MSNFLVLLFKFNLSLTIEGQHHQATKQCILLYYHFIAGSKTLRLSASWEAASRITRAQNEKHSKVLFLK